MEALTLLPETPHARPVPVLTARAGLAVVRDREELCIVHVGSGWPLAWPPVLYLPTPAAAAAAMDVALALLGVDWTANAPAIIARVNRVALLQAMQRAAIPPRRLPYHDHRRRLRPYQAEAKRAAIRLVRGWIAQWYDYDPLRWDRNYGTAIPPQRQPCRRFVARAGLLRGIARRAERSHG